MAGIQCSEFFFYNDFDSANLGKVEYVPPTESVVTKQSTITKSVVPEVPDAEFNIWTKPDCCGTEYENGNRTWFYFGMKANEPSLLVKFNMVDLNRQGKMYSQGMAPVYRILPGKPHWERIRDKPVYKLNDDIFTLTFKFRMPENTQSITYFAFTYPFSYTDLERMLINVDSKFLSFHVNCEDDIYYTRECICYTLDGRSVDLITITSFHGITLEREPRLKDLFPNQNVPRPHKFTGKKIVFVSARVHPGETPSSFVFNGLLNLLLSRDDMVAITLRRLYVFKLIPFLNPDGVARGHYRTDTRGVNLNRVYMSPSFSEHPSVYAARSLIRFYHFGFEKEDTITPTKCENCINISTDDSQTEDNENQQNDRISQKVSHMTLEEGDNNKTPWCAKCKKSVEKLEGAMPGISNIIPKFNLSVSLGRNLCRNCGSVIETKASDDVLVKVENVGSHGDVNGNESDLFLYLDLHGHASKKGIFMYGNHFEDLEKNVECMLLPKLMSINNHNFHFNACNFTERNMYLKDKRDGMSRAGSGRVSVLSLTGIIRSYTLECNYNTGRLVNVLPSTIKEPNSRVHTLPVPPKYTPQLFEEVGRSLGASILDLTGQNPCTRLPNSEFHSLSGLREWLRTNISNEFDQRGRIKMRSCLHSQGKTTRGVIIKSRPPLAKTVSKKPHGKPRSTIPIDRKENLVYRSSSLTEPSCSFHSSKSSLRINKCYGVRTKSRKDISLKAKNISTADKSKTNLNRSKPKAPMVNQKKLKLDHCSKLKSIHESSEKLNTEEDIVQLREICFIKNSEGKTVIAKYKNNKDGEEFDDNLVVSWDSSSSNAQIYTQKTRIASAPPFLSNKSTSEPGTSKQQGAFRVHNFSRNQSFLKSKLKKHTLRRLGSAADSLGKVDKKKKKKVKPK